MEFVRCSVNDQIFGPKKPTELETSRASVILDANLEPKGTYGNEEVLHRIQTPGHVDQAGLLKFFKAMAVCHTVLPKISEEKEHDYQGTSPDEVALVLGAARSGVPFVERKFDFERRCVMEIKVPCTQRAGEFVYERWTLLHVLEFTSDRKRMSVVVRDVDDQILLITKGADQVMIPRFAQDCGPSAKTLRQATSFAREGLRTLVFGQKPIAVDVYEQWRQS